MRRINGERLGSRSLRADAAYCLVLGVAVVVFCGQIAESVALPTLFIAVAGVALALWACGVIWMLLRLPIRTALRLIMVANVLAAVAVGFASVLAATLLTVLAVVAIAIDVALLPRVRPLLYAPFLPKRDSTRSLGTRR